ncbi:MAG: hypothetical protein KC589_09580 [Nanoarchaeota archaeon]|nr:hypothetical protein [Nanoarchaeota archaeon]
MNSFPYTTELLDMNLESIVSLEDLKNENLPDGFLERCDFYAFDTHKDDIRKLTGEPYFNHINEVQAFGEEIAQDNVKNFIGRQFRLHDFGEDIKKNKDRLNGNGSYIEHSPMYSEFPSDPVSLFLAQNVRIMDKKIMENHLISKNIIRDDFKLNKEDKYRLLVLALRGNYGFPLILNRLPDAKLSSIILVPNKMGDMVSNMDFDKSPNIAYYKERYMEEKVIELINDIKRNYLPNIDLYAKIMEQNFYYFKRRNALRILDLFPILINFSLNHEYFDFFYKRDIFLEETDKIQERVIQYLQSGGDKK